MVLSNAYLKDGLSRSLPYSVFRECDGTGLATTVHEARSKAISEAIERWAFWTKYASSEADFYAFDQSPSTVGMAAYPEFRHKRSRDTARQEAAERFIVLAWWEGHLDGKVFNVPHLRCRAVILEAGGYTTAIVYRGIKDTRFFAYGRGAARTATKAIEHAYRELIVFEINLLQFSTPEDLYLTAERTSLIQEKRMLFFAREEGHIAFLDRLQRKQWRQPVSPEVLYDGPLVGPWSQYAKVWRCAYTPLVNEHSKRINIFSF